LNELVKSLGGNGRKRTTARAAKSRAPSAMSADGMGLDSHGTDIDVALMRAGPENKKRDTLSNVVAQNSENPVKTVLLVDDNSDTRLLTKMFLNHFGYEVDPANSAEEALERFNSSRHDLVLTDNSMPDMTGGEMAQIIKMRSPSTPVLMCTGNPPFDRTSIDIVITKPTHLLAIKDAIDKLLTK
jgi:CheY-like chemotaxis protein